MTESKATQIKYIRIGAIIVLVALLLFSVYMLINEWDKRRGGSFEDKSTFFGSTIEYDGNTYSKKEEIETFLLIGLDKFEKAAESNSYNNESYADFVMLFVLDNANNKFTALQFNRDTMVDISKLTIGGKNGGTYKGQLSLSYSEGDGKQMSCRNTADSVSDMLKGVRIDHYASVTMDIVPSLNDLAGGVEISVLDNFENVDSTLVKGKTMVLNGEQALTYVRSREGLEDSTNSSRMVRQRQYLSALYKQLMQKIIEDKSFVMTVLSKVNCVSNCSQQYLIDTANKLSTFEMSEIEPLEGESIMGEQYMEFYPDQDKLEKIVIDTFYQKN